VLEIPRQLKIKLIHNISGGNPCLLIWFCEDEFGLNSLSCILRNMSIILFACNKQSGINKGMFH